jgi:hypothetical protein
MNEKEITPVEFWSNFVKKDFPLFKEIYSSENEMLEYGLKFQQIGDTKTAFIEFYTISEFYRALKLVRDDFVRLIMIISLIERLSSKTDYIEISKWVQIRKAKDMKVLEALRQYNEIEGFGCNHKFRNFFKNRKYLSRNEQISLLESVKYYSIYRDKRISAPLFCYQEECGKGKRNCVFHYDQRSVWETNSYMSDEDDELLRFSIEDCPLIQNENLLNKNLNEFANFIYEMRNKFVHNATLFHLSVEFLGSTSFMVDYIEYEFRYVKKPKFRGTIILKLSPNNLEKLLNRNFKKMLESYIASRVGNSAQI